MYMSEDSRIKSIDMQYTISHSCSGISSQGNASREKKKTSSSCASGAWSIGLPLQQFSIQKYSKRPGLALNNKKSQNGMKHLGSVVPSVASYPISRFPGTKHLTSPSCCSGASLTNFRTIVPGVTSILISSTSSPAAGSEY